ncbi:calcium-binding protein [Acuticoccus sediminis]|uniref:calcium-binding protein n=1 Tax=Acuticoccus sediminis TaxID=2184697 RepID=UPI001CFEEDEB|nr:calcium-binding protein [Acuticoccus sediminis]
MALRIGRGIFDSLEGSASDDIVLGLGGDDIVIGGFGSDWLDGGDGDDIVVTGAIVSGSLLGGAVFEDTDNDVAFGGAGDDVIISVGGADYIDAGEGGETDGDLVAVNRSGNTAELRAFGIDSALAPSPTPVFEGQFVVLNDGTAVTNAEHLRLRGTTMSDTILLANMTSLEETEIFANGGNDVVTTGDSVDSLYGEGGDDLLSAGAGADSVEGGTGNDTILAGAGGDYALGGAGNDLIMGGDGDDAIYGNAGDDTVIGGAGNDTLGGAEPYAGTRAFDTDTYVGGEGADLFSLMFGAINEDVIADFDRREGDSIEIGFNIDIGRDDVEIELVDRRAGTFNVTVEGEGTHTFTAVGALVSDVALLVF